MPNEKIIPFEGNVEETIHVIRGVKVILDRDLARLYSVSTKMLNQAVTRNYERFPLDFMFRLSKEEVSEHAFVRSQIVTLQAGKHLRYLPYAFTELGIAMLSSVLRSPRAVMVNIQIMRTFVKIRQMAGDYADFERKIEVLEMRYDKQFKIVFDALRQLMTEEGSPSNEIGFKTS